MHDGTDGDGRTPGSSIALAPHTVAYLGFCEGGGRAKDARFEAPEAPMGWSVERGVPSPLKKGSGEGAVPPHQKFLKKILVQCVQKFLCSGQRGGIAQCPPP